MSSLIVEVVRVGEISKHPNADTLFCTTVKGWNCIIKDGQLQTGDLALYIPIDAVLPEWLVDNYQLEYLKNGSRVRTVKLRQVLSQGLLLNLPDGHAFREGQNVTEDLGIKKWEPPAPSYQQGVPNRKATRNRPNPNFSRYCDPENIKNFPGVFQPEDMVIVTEKIHGTCFRAGNVLRHWGSGWWSWLKRLLFGKWLGDYEFAVGSRKVHLVGDNPQFYEGNVYHQIAKRYDLKRILPPDCTIYGEIYGDKIQDLAYGKTNGEIDVAFFDMKAGEQYVGWHAFQRFCLRHRLPMVPVLYQGQFSAELIEAHTSGKSRLASSQIREGCVIKTTTEENHMRIGRKILKSINPDYLLRKGGTEYQ